MARSILRAFSYVLGGNLGTLFLSMAITPLLVRVLGSHAYGDYAFMISSLGLLLIVANAGIFDGLRKFIAEDRSFPNWAGHVFGFYTRVAVAVAVLTAAAVVLLATTGIVEAALDERFTLYFLVLAVIVVSEQLSKVVRSALMGFGNERHSEPLKVLDRAVFGVVGISLAAIGYGVTGALLGYAVGGVVITVVGAVLLTRFVSLRDLFRTPPSGFPRRELLSFNALSVVLVFLITSLYHVDVLLLQPIAGSEQTGYYKAALVTAELVWFAPHALQLTLLHSTSTLWSEERTDEIDRLAGRATRWGLLFTLLLAIGLASLADVFVPLYFGSGFDAAIRPLLLLLPGAVGFAVARPIYAIGQGTGDLRVLVYATGAAAAINLVLNLLLIPVYGTAGAAVATSIGYGSMLILHDRGARSIGFDPTHDLRLSRIALTAVVSLPIIVGLPIVIGHDLLSLVIVPPVGFLVYSILAVKTGAVNADEVRILLDRLPAFR